MMKSAFSTMVETKMHGNIKKNRHHQSENHNPVRYLSHGRKIRYVKNHVRHGSL